MDAVSRLELALLHRPGRKLSEAAYETERVSFDFVVDDQRLSALIPRDVASCLGWGTPAAQSQNVAKILLRGEPDVPPNRYALYVCPECGDLGCGALTAVIERDGDAIIWRDFAWQNNYEDKVWREGFEDLGQFRFDAPSYERLLLGASLSSVKRDSVR